MHVVNNQIVIAWQARKFPSGFDKSPLDICLVCNSALHRGALQTFTEVVEARGRQGNQDRTRHLETNGSCALHLDFQEDIA